MTSLLAVHPQDSTHYEATQAILRKYDPEYAKAQAKEREAARREASQAPRAPATPGATPVRVLLPPHHADHENPTPHCSVPRRLVLPCWVAIAIQCLPQRHCEFESDISVHLSLVVLHANLAALVTVLQCVNSVPAAYQPVRLIKLQIRDAQASPCFAC